ncbi:NAD-dependent epimerase/dehydratase family protein [Novosphingobium cyanobacteriorum]|uniref:NAD-dependent epimerase/dehydratase family protein n=1 Tax=Novosphingobium cyanobacteriorum TaxID=3024215 RepID=A0ABT6CIL3_9SPHN|nr:NAD-dependent epimerase/dehydratase family protein [Novosphingobium cyanobacteriorum]MDF8333756.1 NAD-dependent epimerase/dehydratase family protein [Novosphingobium cyanobacteriorum]
MMRRVLVVGGAGLIGGAIAVHLRSLGHDVTIMGRRAPAKGGLDGIAFMQGSFLDPAINKARLAPFDTLVFAAGNDLRQVPPDDAERNHFHHANTIGVPAFIARAKRAGMACCVYVGTYYPHLVAPEVVAGEPYLRSRLAAEKALLALSDDTFRVCSLNAPFVPGKVDGVSSLPIDALVRFLIAEGDDAWIIPGGSNFISTNAFAEAAAGAIERGEGGAAYLMGDETWTYEHYCNLLLEGMGRGPIRHVRDEPHPVFVDESLYAGRTTQIAYEPDPAMVALLGYTRNETAAVVKAIAPYYEARALAGTPI